MMPDFMRNHVGLGEITGRPESVAHLIEKNQIDIDFLVGRTIERSHRGLSEAASRLRGAAEHDQGRLLITSALLLENYFPYIFGIAHDDRNHVGKRIVLEVFT